MKQLVLFFALIALLGTLAVTAVPDSAVIGPYKMSFDMGLTRNDYNLTVYSPKESESISGEKYTSYMIRIDGKQVDLYTPKWIEMGLVQFEDQTISTPSELANLINKTFNSNPQYMDFAVSTRKIDGTVGAIGSYTYNRILTSVSGYQVFYCPLIDPSHLRCFIVSYFPWDEGTLALLKTIHIEMADQNTKIV